MKNRILVSCLVGIAVVASQAFAQSGTLDNSFGAGGIVAGTSGFSFMGIALAPNGDIVVSGTVFDPLIGDVATLQRYLPSGALDPSFGTGGVVTLLPPASYGLAESFTLGLAVQANGSILTIFYASNNEATASETLLLRLTPQGTPDAAFGSNGQVTLNFPTPTGWGASATTVIAQPDGKILLTGNITPPFRNHSAPLTLLARYLSNGAPDSSFGSGGLVEVATAVDLPAAIALHSDDSFETVSAIGAITDFSAAGSVVSSPSGTPVVATSNGGDIAILSNGEFLAATSTPGTVGRLNLDTIVERFESNGTLDSSFASPVIRLLPDGPSVKNLAAGIKIDSAGRALVAIEGENATAQSGVARVNANGSLDTTFNKTGVSPALPGFVVYGLIVQSDNRPILVSGNGTLARFLAQ